MRLLSDSISRSCKGDSQQWRAEIEVANYGPETMNLWPIWVELEGEAL